MSDDSFIREVNEEIRREQAQKLWDRFGPAILGIAIYGIAGLLFGLTGVMQMSRLRQGDPTVANGAELDIIAAVVIGGGSLNGGEGSIAGSIIGALIMAFLRNGCQQMGWPNYIQEIIIGVIIVLAVALDRLRATWAERSAAAALAAGV